jgi:hypothetical protein
LTSLERQLVAFLSFIIKQRFNRNSSDGAEVFRFFFVVVVVTERIIASPVNTK